MSIARTHGNAQFAIKVADNGTEFINCELIKIAD
jgi:hypothetical protein